ncbi:MAG: hypothetical protein L0G59_07685, partial [Kocuria sp.]|nr:hypothetical protein [Kocuria sp.]
MRELLPMLDLSCSILPQAEAMYIQNGASMGACPTTQQRWSGKTVPSPITAQHSRQKVSAHKGAPRGGG